SLDVMKWRGPSAGFVRKTAGVFEVRCPVFESIDVGGRQPELFDSISTIGDQTAGGDEVAVKIDRRQPVSCRKRNNQIATNQCERAPGRDQTTIGAACEGRESALHLTCIDQVDGAHLDADGGRGGLNCGPLANAG